MPFTSSVSKGVALENRIADAFEERGYIVFLLRNHIDVLAVRHDNHAYLVECKNYRLCRSQQMKAVKQLNRNLQYALEVLQDYRLSVNPKYITRVLVAQGFAYQSRGILQYNPEEFLNHIAGKHLKSSQILETSEERISARGVCSVDTFGDSGGLVMVVP